MREGGGGGAVLKDFYGSHGFQGDEGGISQNIKWTVEILSANEGEH